MIVVIELGQCFPAIYRRLNLILNELMIYILKFTYEVQLRLIPVLHFVFF